MAILVRQNTGTTALDTTGTSVVGAPTGSVFSVNSSNTNSPSLAASLTSSITGSTRTTALPASADTPISSTQPVSLRTLIAISVAAFILIAGAVIFVLWFGSRARQTNKDGSPKDDHVDYSHESTAEDVNVNLKGMGGTGAGGGMPPLPSTLPTKKSMGSGRTSNYSQSTAQNPPLSFHQRKSTADSWDPKPPRSVHTYDAEPIQLPQNAAYNISMYSQYSQPEAQSPYSEGAAGTSQQSPRSAYAQPITHPYTIGAHPYASPSLRPGPSQSRPSIEHNGNYSVAMAAAPESDGVGLGLSGFAGAGTRPGYDAYGIESRQPVALNTRPSLESVRSLAKKQSMEKVAVAAATDFAIGGPQAVGSSRSRQNSITSSIRQGNGSMAPSIRSRKDSTKEKRTKEERAREMAAMDNLIAALDESAAKERKRKESLASAAGLNDPGSGSGSTPRRKEVAVTGSYPLPPAEVFRKALSSAGRPSTDTNDVDDIDDEEIERWRRK